MWLSQQGGLGVRLRCGGVIRRSLTRGSGERYPFRSITGEGAAGGDERKIQVDLILENELRKLIPNKQRKTKIKVSMSPLPTLQSLKKQVSHAFPNLNGIPYGLRFVIPHKVWAISFHISHTSPHFPLSTSPSFPPDRYYSALPE
jgi:hypothetical protein